MKTNDILLYGGLALGAYLLLKKPAATTQPVLSSNPGGAYPVPAPPQSGAAALITTTGNAITNLIDQLTGNAPNPNNQIPVTNTPVIIPTPVVSTPVITVPVTSAQDLSAQAQGFADYAAQEAYDEQMYQNYQAGMLSGVGDFISGYKLEFMRGGHTS
jgi:hypothetical protein